MNATQVPFNARVERGLPLTAQKLVGYTHREFNGVPYDVKIPKRWSRLNYEGSAVRTKCVSISFGPKKAPIGRVEIRLLTIYYGESDYAFCDECDEHSASLDEVASVLTAAWSNLSKTVFYSGPLVLLDSAFIAAGNKIPWMEIVEQAISEATPEYGLMILKAYPLEYAGNITPENEGEFNRRQQALMRYYSARLNVSAFPGASGSMGWMWRQSIESEMRIKAPKAAQPVSHMTKLYGVQPS